MEEVRDWAEETKLRQCQGGDLEGVAGGGQARGESQDQRVFTLLQHGFNGIGGLWRTRSRSVTA